MKQPLTKEQFHQVMPWLVLIAEEKGVAAPNGLSIEDSDSSYDDETDFFSIRAYDANGDEEDFLTHGVTLVFSSAKIDQFVEADKHTLKVGDSVVVDPPDKDYGAIFPALWEFIGTITEIDAESGMASVRDQDDDVFDNIPLRCILLDQ
jgi:hypothetical protein